MFKRLTLVMRVVERAFILAVGHKVTIFVIDSFASLLMYEHSIFRLAIHSVDIEFNGVIQTRKNKCSFLFELLIIKVCFIVFGQVEFVRSINGET
jgi:hypothetical protein